MSPLARAISNNHKRGKAYGRIEKMAGSKKNPSKTNECNITKNRAYAKNCNQKILHFPTLALYALTGLSAFGFLGFFFSLSGLDAPFAI